MVKSWNARSGWSLFCILISQYQTSTDKRGGITNDPNRPDDPQYILRLIAQVITVGLEAFKLVKALPPLETA